MTHAEAIQRYLHATNQKQRETAKRELARFDAARKVSKPSHFVPLGGANAQDILR